MRIYARLLYHVSSQCMSFVCHYNIQKRGFSHSSSYLILSLHPQDLFARIEQLERNARDNTENIERYVWYCVILCVCVMLDVGTLYWCIPCHITSFYSTSLHNTLFYSTSLHTTSYYSTPPHSVTYHYKLIHTITYHITTHHFILLHTTSFHYTPLRALQGWRCQRQSVWIQNIRHRRRTSSHTSYCNGNNNHHNNYRNHHRNHFSCRSAHPARHDSARYVQLMCAIVFESPQCPVVI
jgi:hypothetical protein